ncbi:MAG: ribose-5-phosphate isomerase [spirochete symbiont of Stewartia floridana]|nr:MAG: ribose-5-phosphate isomerase [spirochete symbiont of Stewartia floridana]
MKFVIASDHAAVELKSRITAWLIENGHRVTDLGVEEGGKADYPDKGEEAALRFLEGGFDYGVVCCGTGIGISIAVNKVKGLRCALPQDCYAARMAKEHNDCQFIAFGARIHYTDGITDILGAFLDARFEQESRHAARVEKIMAIESKDFPGC